MLFQRYVDARGVSYKLRKSIPHPAAAQVIAYGAMT
jgi:hypothetical protein